MHNINITLASHNQAQQGSKTKLQNKLLNQRKTVKSQSCTIEKLENKAPKSEKDSKQTEYKDIQQKKTLPFLLTTNRTTELNQTGKQKGKSQPCTT